MLLFLITGVIIILGLIFDINARLLY